MPVNFDELKKQGPRRTIIEPREIFRRLPKPPGVNDLYQSQAEVLDAWFERRDKRDTVVKLHTGGGKTLVGLLMAQSTLAETKEPVLYLAPNKQLVNQTVQKARDLGIPVVAYQTGQPLDDDFRNGKALMVATYKALFHGRSKFGVRGVAAPVRVSAVILDDAHSAFSVIRESFTLEIQAKEEPELYSSLTGLFRHAFAQIDRIGTFDDTIEGASGAVIEVPYWSWREQVDAVRTYLKECKDRQFNFVWPLLRDNLALCHALISGDRFTITTLLPLVNMFPTFAEAPRRIYMSGTIADDSEIVRTFDADAKLLNEPLSSRSLAGISERMILIPGLMDLERPREAVQRLVTWTATSRKIGSVVLVPSNLKATAWSEIANTPDGEQVENWVNALQNRSHNGPVVFANRYDGIDLPQDSCRLLVMDGLPSGTSDYELFRASTLYGGATINRVLAQRIEQGIGRGARGSGDYCVVILLGADLASWIAKDANFNLLTSASRVQIEIGTAVSREVKGAADLQATMLTSFDRNKGWISYHADSLADAVKDEAKNIERFAVATAERRAFNAWQDGSYSKAITLLDELSGNVAVDTQTRGWLLQTAARIADSWSQAERAEDLQRNAFGHNRNLLRPKTTPPYRPLQMPQAQALAIAGQFKGYRLRRGLLQKFEEVVSQLTPNSSSNQYEQALMELGLMLGLSSERHDKGGEGPDVLWVLPNKTGFVIEAKSRKKAKNAMGKDDHGQLLVAGNWFEQQYPGYSCVRVSVHPTKYATKPAVPEGSFALTPSKLAELIVSTRMLLTALSESQLDDREMSVECERLLNGSAVKSDRLAKNFLEAFVRQ